MKSIEFDSTDSEVEKREDKVFILSYARHNGSEFLGRFNSMEQVLKAYHALKMNPEFAESYDSINDCIKPLSIEWSEGWRRSRVSRPCFVVSVEEPVLFVNELFIMWSDGVLTTRINGYDWSKSGDIRSDLHYSRGELCGNFTIITSKSVDMEKFSALFDE